MNARPVDTLLVLRERKKVLDASWLMTFVVVFLAIAIPWYLRMLDIDFGIAAWTLFVYACAYTGVSVAADRVTNRTILMAILTALQLSGVVFLTWQWLLVGGVQTPLFLVVFAVPILLSGLISLAWQPYVMAGVSIVLVSGAAVASSPSLRWYLVRLDVPLADLVARLPDTLLFTGSPFPATEAQPTSAFVGLLLFAVFLVGIAVITDTLTSVLVRLQIRLRTSTDALAEAEGLAGAVLTAAPEPAALINRDNHQVVRASDSFRRQLLLETDELRDKTLFELIDFSFPEVIERVLSGGEVPFAVYRVGEETRVCRVTAHPLRHAGTDYAHLTLHDVSDLYYLKGALNELTEPHLVIGADRRLRYFNRAAERVFDGLYLGALGDHILEGRGAPTRWWDLGPRRRHERQITLDGATVRADLSAVDIPGEAHGFTVVTLRRGDR